MSPCTYCYLEHDWSGGTAGCCGIAGALLARRSRAPVWTSPGLVDSVSTETWEVQYAALDPSVGVWLWRRELPRLLAIGHKLATRTIAVDTTVCCGATPTDLTAPLGTGGIGDRDVHLWAHELCGMLELVRRSDTAARDYRWTRSSAAFQSRCLACLRRRSGGSAPTQVWSPLCPSKPTIAGNAGADTAVTSARLSEKNATPAPHSGSCPAGSRSPAVLPPARSRDTVGRNTTAR